MLTRRFDYGGWVVACLALGLLQTLLWLRWAWWTREGATHPSRRSLLVFIASLNAASLLEVLDFPPLLWHTLDAHAVWHLATIPLWALWYRFVLLDLQAGQVMWSLPLDSAGEDKEL
ncbi:Post-GPI attachment to proteins factor 3 [Auxenochlorella protothecoides]|nr:Post-GPI attachment to proteins factor 3 [Auxenochlorella protothecoides]KFM27229.1 Post-GPI attachment to proteins factor 3 [Auxenochlorella protothecoides]